ncbi:MAG TPA: heme-binding protein [Nocardioides sp.]|nr:heme-binding protein [Nocardioides sp.]
MTDIQLDAARALVRRAIDKAEQLGISGAIAVVGASGALVTASRMDEGGAGGLGRARSKAWIAATQRIPSTEHLNRMTTLPPAIAAGFVAVSPEAAFPGAGGMPVRDDTGRITGAVAASGATVSPFFPAELERRYSTVDGRPANPEDQVVAYALGVPYVGQHGDDKPRWEQRYGPWQDHEAQPPVAVPRASGQPELDRAVALADRVLASGQPVAVVVVDRRGEVVHEVAADAAPTAATYVAEGVAAAAALFGRPSGEAGELVAAARHVLPVPVVALAGGRPLLGGGALGVAGPDPEVCDRLAAEALA